MSFKVEGLSQMMADLQLLEEQSDELAPKMLEAAAPILERSLKGTLSTHVRTGELVGSIQTTKASKGEKGWHITVRPTGKDRKGVRNMEKMAYLEYGTSKQPATPVLAPAVRQAEGACIQAMQRVFDEATT